MSGGMFIEVDGQPVACANSHTWSAWFETADRCVARTMVGQATVSTVFLGLDHGWSGGEPVLYETMIMDQSGDSWDDLQRYCTRQEALVGHQQTVSELALQRPGAAVYDVTPSAAVAAVARSGGVDLDGPTGGASPKLDPMNRWKEI